MSKQYQPERRTFLQDRFEILIKRQKNGTATFNELTELDEIVNRDPELREKVFREDILMEKPTDFEEPPVNDELLAAPEKRRTMFARIKNLLSRLFDAQFKGLKTWLQQPAMLA
jgi:hypothetical protein